MKKKIITTSLALSFFLLSGISMNAQAAFHDSRIEKWEFYLAPMLTNSKVLQFNNGAEADINKRSSIGFGFGYNINAHIELTGLFSSSHGNYTGTRIIDNTPEDPDNPNGPQIFSSNMYTSSLEFGFTYNLLSTPFTPYISANVGTTYIDSGIPTGNINTGYCWDPWYGYYYPCANAETYTSTEINYGLALGLRYDFNRKLYIKGDLGKNYLDLDSSNTPDFTTYRFIFGFMF